MTDSKITDSWVDQRQFGERFQWEIAWSQFSWFKPLPPLLNHFQYSCHLKMVMNHGIFPQIPLRQAKKWNGRLRSILLKMDKSSRQLNQSFVKITIRSRPLRQPKALEHLMGFEIEPLVETFDITQITGIYRSSSESLDQLFDPITFWWHIYQVRRGSRLTCRRGRDHAARSWAKSPRDTQFHRKRDACRYAEKFCCIQQKKSKVSVNVSIANHFIPVKVICRWPIRLNPLEWSLEIVPCLWYSPGKQKAWGLSALSR